MMDGCYRKGAPCLERILRNIFITDPKWNSYIRSTTKDAEKNVGSLYRLTKYLTPPAMLSIYKNEIRLK